MYSIMPEFKKEFKLVVKPLNKDNAKKKSSAILWSNLLDDKSSLDQTETRDDDTKPIKPHLFDDNDD